MRAKRSENERGGMPVIHKMDLKELYILSFYFHAFDFIIRTTYGFTKSKDTWCRNVGSSASRLATAQLNHMGGDVTLPVYSPSEDYMQHFEENILQTEIDAGSPSVSSVCISAP